MSSADTGAKGVGNDGAAGSGNGWRQDLVATPVQLLQTPTEAVVLDDCWTAAEVLAGVISDFCT